MIFNPPPISPDWTTEERATYAAWCAQISMLRIDRDDSAVPFLAKTPVRALLQAIYAVLTWPVDRLELNREALEKPLDTSKNYDGILISQKLLEVIKREFCQ